MDPATIIGVTTAVVRLCATVSGHIFTFVSNAKNVDEAITTLGVEINALSEVLRSISDSLRDKTLVNAISNSRTGHEAQHWRNVKRSLNDCKNMLERMVRVMDGVSPRRTGGFFSRAKTQINFGMRMVEVTSLKQQVTAYRQTLQLSLQLITVYRFLSEWESNFSVHMCFLGTKHCLQIK
jgi:hypothetical protein